MSAQGHSQDESHAPAGMRTMYFVWGWLLVLTAIEVLLAYLHTPVLIMLVCLLGFSILKAALIMGWFMHLKFERMSVVLTIVPAMIMCLLLMNIIFGDSARLRSKGLFRDIPSAQFAQPTGHGEGGGEGEAPHGEGEVHPAESGQ
jgi:cytochrome c oxidase subunit IV